MDINDLSGITTKLIMQEARDFHPALAEMFNVFLEHSDEEDNFLAGTEAVLGHFLESAEFEKEMQAFFESDSIDLEETREVMNRLRNNIFGILEIPFIERVLDDWQTALETANNLPHRNLPLLVIYQEKPHFV